MSAQPVYTFAKWQVKEGNLDEVLQLLAEAAKESSKEEGNLFYKAHQSNADANTLMLYEGYVDDAALAVHRDSSHFKTLVVGKIVPLLEHREVMLATELFVE